VADYANHHDDPQFFRDLLRLFRAARRFRNSRKSLTERQRAALDDNGMGPANSALVLAVEMLEGYTRKKRPHE